MSTWYQYNLHAIAVDTRAVANFFALPKGDIHSEYFELSFGGKNGACLPIDLLIKDHPDIIWLIEQQVECDTENIWIQRYDNIVQENQAIHLESHGFMNNEVNKRLLEEYEKEHPGLSKKHLNGEKGYERFRWSMFFSNFSKAARILRQYKDYEEMTLPTIDADVEFDNLPLEG
jgi:hypothetical protein